MNPTGVLVSRPTIIRAVLLDLSGTVHIGHHVIPGAIEACQKLSQHNIDVSFLTNTTTKSRKELIDQLREMGFPEDIVQEEKIVTNTQAASQLIRQYNLRPYGLIQDNLWEDLQIQQTQECDISAKIDVSVYYNSVLVGLAPQALVYPRLNQAFRVLINERDRRRRDSDLAQPSSHPSPPLIVALHKGKYQRDVDGQLSLGPGGFVVCLQEAAGIPDHEIAIMGKPSTEFFQAAVPYGILPQETAMVGDDVQQDVVGAKRAGFGLGILVKTGKYQQGDESSVQSTLAPDFVANSILEAVDFILERNNAGRQENTV